jgi:hypothetical protein
MATEIREGRPAGAAVAAFISASLGILALAVSHLLCEVSDPIKGSVHALGKLWIPGAEGIGPYSGKETIQLLVWLPSWLVLHLLLRKKNVSVWWSGLVFLMIIGVATTLLWPPVTHVVAEAIK